MIVLLVITDGREECLERTLESAEVNLSGPISRRIMYDDTGDPKHREMLAKKYTDFDLRWHPSGRQGFAGAIQTAWRFIAAIDESFVFHLEADFIFNRPVDLMSMVTVLKENPHLAQLVLKRQPWNDQEKAAGGIVECWPDEYQERSNGVSSWLEHRLFFSTNPSLYHKKLVEKNWPDAPKSESRFTKKILENPKAKFAFWGQRNDPPWVTHIGVDRVGTGY